MLLPLVLLLLWLDLIRRQHEIKLRIFFHASEDDDDNVVISATTPADKTIL